MPPLILNWILSTPLKDIRRTIGRSSAETKDEKVVTHQWQFSDLDGCAGLGRKSPCRKIGPYSERVGEGNGTPLQYSWRIPWMEEPGGLQSMGSLRVRHD